MVAAKRYEQWICQLLCIPFALHLFQAHNFLKTFQGLSLVISIQKTCIRQQVEECLQ